MKIMKKRKKKLFNVRLVCTKITFVDKLEDRFPEKTKRMDEILAVLKWAPGFRPDKP